MVLRTASLAAFFACHALGCTTSPAKDSSTTERDASTLKATPARDASANASASNACSSDADCRTASSYCREAPCVCRVLSKDEPSPTCASGKSNDLTCFADPCMRKKAACQEGKCALVVESSK